MKQHIRQLIALSFTLLTLCTAFVGPTAAAPIGYYITGYTGSFTADPTGIDDVGYYGLTLWGNTADVSAGSAINLSGSLALYAANTDGTRDITNSTVLYSSSLLDVFYLSYFGTVLELGNADGALLSLDFSANPSGTAPTYQNAMGFNGTYNLLAPNNVYVNTLWPEGSYDPLGNLTNPTAVYGQILMDTFTVTGTNGDFIEMIIDDAQIGAVPEPSTLALLGLGLAGIGIWRRRQKGAIA